MSEYVHLASKPFSSGQLPKIKVFAKPTKTCRIKGRWKKNTYECFFVPPFFQIDLGRKKLIELFFMPDAISKSINVCFIARDQYLYKQMKAAALSPKPPSMK